MPISSALGSSALLPAGLGFRNVLTNGAMQVHQRGTSPAFASGSGAYYYGADRWRTQDYIWSSGSNITVSNETTVVPAGFTNSYKWANGATGLTFSSGGNQHINQAIEGYNASALYGKTCSLSFWVRSSTAGKYTVFFYNNAFTRGLLKTYTISAVNTWEYKTMTIDMASAVSSGVWEKTTSAGLHVQFMLGTHADRTGNSNLDSWGSLPPYHYATSDSVNLATIANSTFYLTGVQLEQNYQPTPFEQRPIGVELSLCQRYYSFMDFTGGAQNFVDGYNTNIGYLTLWVKLPQTMRVRPTSVSLVVSGLNNTSGHAASANNSDYINVYANFSTTGRGYYYVNSLSVSAEL